MGQNKLQRFADIAGFNNVFEYPENMKGNWNDHFKNEYQITLELACGKGEYAIGLASLYPERNFIGVDVKGNRIWVGAKTAIENNASNVAFLRTQIGMIDSYFSLNEVNEIWITFPDPQLRISNIRRRLTHPIFLRKYKQFLSPSGYINLKTDSPTLYAFTKEVINTYGFELLADSNDISRDFPGHAELEIRTHYENLDIAKSKRIHYLKFNIDGEIDQALDEVLKEKVIEIEKGIKEGFYRDEKKAD
jgi:tRNA (guanine-N7-)-methyltransferase